MAVAIVAKLDSSSSGSVAVHTFWKCSSNICTMTPVSNAPRATVASADAFAVIIVAKLDSSSSGSVAVCPATRTSDNAFVVAIVAKLDVGVAIAA